MLNQAPAADAVLQALADPSRRLMVERLCRGPASVSELARPLRMSLAGVVQHLHVLEESGVVSSQKTGRVRICRVQPAALGAAERWFSSRRAMLEEQMDRLGEYLAAQSEEPRNTSGHKEE